MRGDDTKDMTTDDAKAVVVLFILLTAMFIIGLSTGYTIFDQTEEIKKGHPIVIDNQVYRCEKERGE